MIVIVASIILVVYTNSNNSKFPIYFFTDRLWLSRFRRTCQRMGGKNVDPVHLFLSLSSESEFHWKPPPMALSAVACININLW